MAENRMADVAKLLGVSIGEKFKAKYTGRALRDKGIAEEGKFHIELSGVYRTECGSNLGGFLSELLKGDLEITKLPHEPIGGCPLCNGVSCIIPIKSISCVSRNDYAVACTQCGCRGPIAETKEEAIWNWNKRG